MKALSKCKTNFDYFISAESFAKLFEHEKKYHPHEKSKFCLSSDFHRNYKGWSKKSFAEAAQMFGSDIKPTTGMWEV